MRDCFGCLVGICGILWDGIRGVVENVRRRIGERERENHGVRTTALLDHGKSEGFRSEGIRTEGFDLDGKRDVYKDIVDRTSDRLIGLDQLHASLLTSEVSARVNAYAQILARIQVDGRQGSEEQPKRGLLATSDSRISRQSILSAPMTPASEEEVELMQDLGEKLVNSYGAISIRPVGDLIVMLDFESSNQ
eukprot:CAMPEP_0184690096 /NCGR_PEP_ID=MMETSP0312-20130426/31027_1 /TAXON_ID=31354 /ORGANISM="Compsopogon coeruleus, Strain SAG 36.94" /LENGTH=191 /DNA_ID=CAMNT_0027147531 /DNA_START=157 /DNA_END=732 /DNA_ORIENTATION=+